MELTKQDRDLIAGARKRLKSGPYFVVGVSSFLLVKAAFLGLLVDNLFSIRDLPLPADPAHELMGRMLANGSLHFGILILLSVGFQVILLSLHRSRCRTDRLLVDLVEERAGARVRN